MTAKKRKIGEDPLVKGFKFKSVDEWLSTHEGDGVYCSPKGVSVTIPKDCKRCGEAFDLLRETMTELFYGSTTVDGYGTWVDDDEKSLTFGQVVGEPVRTITSAYSCTNEETRKKLAMVVKTAGIMARQSSMGVRGHDFHVIPTEKIIAPHVYHPLGESLKKKMR